MNCPLDHRGFVRTTRMYSALQVLLEKTWDTFVVTSLTMHDAQRCMLPVTQNQYRLRGCKEACRMAHARMSETSDVCSTQVRL
jgi:hypothetical protein